MAASTIIALVLGSFVGLYLLAVVVFAAYESSAARRQRRSIVELRAEAPSQRAAAAVVKARGEFSQAVEAYETAMVGLGSAVGRPLDRITVGGSTVGASGGTPGALGGSLFGNDRPVAPIVSRASESVVLDLNDIAELEHRKEIARNNLLDAQRLWDSVRPAHGPESALDLWSGTGVLRGWQVGPIGFERAFIRCDHVVDASCWAAFEVKRLRLGLAFSMEEQHLAVFAAAVPAERMGEIIGRSMGGTEFAARPGFAPLRSWRRARRIPEARRAAFSLLTTRTPDQAIDSATRATVRNALEVELGQPLDRLRSLGGMTGVMSVLASGPSLTLGAWGGRSPQAELLAASPHTAWHQQS